MKKRVLSLLVCLCLLPVPVLDAAAEEPASLCVEGCSLEEGHEGACVLHEARYQTEANGEWVYGPLAAACAGVYADGRVEVLRDIAPGSPVEIRRPLTLTSADPEAPCKITYTSERESDPFHLTIYADVTLRDIILDGGREEGLTTHTELVGVQSGTLTLGAGAVLQNNDNVDTAKGAGGLRVMGGTAVMQKGSLIRNCRAIAGGGAAVADDEAILVLNGGIIEDCQAILGGGVFMEGASTGGILRIYDGGAIQNNEAVREIEGVQYSHSNVPGNGGGLYVERGSVYMFGGGDGGFIGNNSAENSGGGIYVSYGRLQLANGSVTENAAQKYGGGIVASANAVILVGNGPNVSGSTGGEKYFYDLYLDGYEDDTTTDTTRPMTIGAALWDKASIGVSRWVRPDKEHPYRIVAVPYRLTITESDLEKFFSTDPAYIVLLHEGNIVLANADVIFDAQGHGVAPESQRVGESRKVIRPTDLTEEGYSFGGWYQEPECKTAWDFENGTIAELSEGPLILYAKWEPIPYPIQYEMDGGENAAENPDSYTIESETITLNVPTRKGYTFLGWTWAGESVPQKSASIPSGSTGERTFTAHWEEAPTCTVTYTDGAGGTIFTDEVYSELLQGEDTPYFSGSTARSGYTFNGWSPKVADKVTGDAVYTAQWTKKSTSSSRPSRPDPKPEEEKPPETAPGLESKDHFAYIVGYPDGTVRPEACISRCEVVSIFFRLMTDDFREENWASSNPFPDVGAGAWYNNAVSTGLRAGLIRGLPDGTFGGGRSITRAEFAAIAARFLSEESAPDSGFADLEGHWAKGEVDRAVAAGWIKGYPDGGFHPDENITRAEVMTLVNRMLDRVPSLEGMEEGMILWPDNPADAWYYADVQEATNGHTYDRNGPKSPETWTGLTEDRDWTELEW